MAGTSSRALPRWLAPVLACAVVFSLVLAVAVYFLGDGVRDVRHSDTVPPAVVQMAGCPTDAGRMPKGDGIGGVQGSGAIPAGFRPLTLLRCRFSSEYVDDALTRSRITVVEERTESLPPELLGVLALPDQEFDRSFMACDLLPDPWVVTSVVDQAGNAVVPRMPRDPCGSPRPEVSAALAAAVWTRVGSRTFEAPAQ